LIVSSSIYLFIYGRQGNVLRSILLASVFVFFAAVVSKADAGFDLTISIGSPASFSPSQLVHLQAAINTAEELWESVITGYQPGINLTGMTIQVFAGSAFAEANYPMTVVQAGYTLSTYTSINVNPSVIDNYTSWTGVGPLNPNPAYLGLNYLDDIMAHEIGHALGIGLLWEENGVYELATGEYAGKFGLAAYRAEFDANASFVPVEQALTPAADLHWNQIMRSSPDEGNPSDPFSLSPLTGVTDALGRDFGQELMTGAIDADYGEPFLSRTTIQSLRDLGFTVIPEPSTFAMGGLAMVGLIMRATTADRLIGMRRAT
jgi:hypothetical protein